MRYFTTIKQNTFLNQSEDELNFCTHMNVVSRSHRTFFFQLFIFSSFSCSFFQSLDVSQLLTVSASEHCMDICIPFSKNGKNWTYKRSDISILVNYVECSSGLHRFFFIKNMSTRRIEMMLLSVSLTDSSFAFHLDISSFFFLILFVQDIILGKFSFFFLFFV